MSRSAAADDRRAGSLMVVTDIPASLAPPLQCVDVPVACSSSCVRLVARLESSGGWPEPRVLAAIADCGEPAVMALASYIRGALMGCRRREPLVTAIRLLGAIGGGAARSVLSSLVEECSGEILDAAAEALAEIGPEAAPVCLAAAGQADLPLANRVAAMSAACDAVRRGSAGPATVGRELHLLVLSGICRGEKQTRSERLLMAAAVEVLARLGYIAARPAIDIAFDRGLILGRELSHADIDGLYDRPLREARRLGFLADYTAAYRRRFGRSTRTPGIMAG